MELEEKFGILHKVLFKVEKLRLWDNVALAIMVVLSRPEKSPWSLRKVFSLKELCVPTTSHPGVKNEGPLLSLSQKNWGSGHGGLGRPGGSCGWKLSCFPQPGSLEP